MICFIRRKTLTATILRVPAIRRKQSTPLLLHEKRFKEKQSVSIADLDGGEKDSVAYKDHEVFTY